MSGRENKVYYLTPDVVVPVIILPDVRAVPVSIAPEISVPEEVSASPELSVVVGATKMYEMNGVTTVSTRIMTISRMTIFVNNFFL